MHWKLIICRLRAPLHLPPPSIKTLLGTVCTQCLNTGSSLGVMAVSESSLHRGFNFPIQKN